MLGCATASGPEILRDVSFHVIPDSFHFLTGPSGAGKTTLLRLLFMSLQPTRGLIIVFGEDVADLSPPDCAELRRRIGIVFQDFRLLDHLTTCENVALPCGSGQGRGPTTAKTSPSFCTGSGWATASTPAAESCPAARSRARRSPAR